MCMGKLATYVISMQIFGEKDIFAISYKTGPEWNSGNQPLIYCHLILKGILIGDPEEVDLLGTCVGHLQRLRDKVQKNEGYLSDPPFDGLDDNEVMELIYKSNQLEEDYDPVFSYLPSAETNDLWYRHTVSLAESTDHYAIVVFEEKEKLKFLWQKWEDRENRLETINSVFVEHKIFYAAINEFLLFAKATYPESLEWFNPQWPTT
jgi:immunity protein 42 of polymorphic toxin system